MCIRDSHCINWLHLPSDLWKTMQFLEKFSHSPTWETGDRCRHIEYAVWGERYYLRERLSSLAWIFLHWRQNSTGIGSVVCDHHNSSSGYRVVLHVFKYSYRDSISEQANSGSLAKAMEKAHNCCNCECIGDSDLDKHKPVDRYKGKIPQRERLLWITIYSSLISFTS